MRHSVGLKSHDALEVVGGLEFAWSFVGVAQARSHFVRLKLQHEEPGLGACQLVLHADGTWEMYTEICTGDDHDKA